MAALTRESTPGQRSLVRGASTCAHHQSRKTVVGSNQTQHGPKERGSPARRPGPSPSRTTARSCARGPPDRNGTAQQRAPSPDDRATTPPGATPSRTKPRPRAPPLDLRPHQHRFRKTRIPPQRRSPNASRFGALIVPSREPQESPLGTDARSGTGLGRLYFRAGAAHDDFPPHTGDRGRFPKVAAQSRHAAGIGAFSRARAPHSPTLATGRAAGRHFPSLHVLVWNGRARYSRPTHEMVEPKSHRPPHPLRR